MDPNILANEPDLTKDGVHNFLGRYVQRVHNYQFIRMALKVNPQASYVDIIGPSDIAYVIAIIKKSGEMCWYIAVDTLNTLGSLFLGSLSGYKPFLRFFSMLGVGPDPRVALPLARLWSICYPQHSVGGRRRYHCIVRLLEKAIKLSHTSQLMVCLYYYLIYKGIV